MKNSEPATDCQEPTDAELIRDYVENKSTTAFETLLRRHYQTVHTRLLALTKNQADADDLAQKLWLRVLNNLPNYQDQQRFPNFLNTIATNLVKDEWRRQSNTAQSSLDEWMENHANGSAGDLLMVEEDIPEVLHRRSEITHLVQVLIPRLAVKLRAVFLLRHESEYWDEKQPFQWQHLGELNNMSTDEAYQRFIQARDSLVTGEQSPASISDEDRLIFLIWTQAQRWQKSAKHTESYLASLLNIPTNTFKTRYRAALAELSSGLEQWRNQQKSV